jgi:hypothetical protein
VTVVFMLSHCTTDTWDVPTDPLYCRQSSSTSSSKITVSGLLGFTNPDSSAQNALRILPASATSIQGIFMEDNVKWTKDTGSLVFTVANGQKLSAGRTYAFQVRLTNPFVEQSSPDVLITTSGDTSIPAFRMQKGAGEAAPLLVLKPKLLTAKVRIHNSRDRLTASNQHADENSQAFYASCKKNM